MNIRSALILVVMASVGCKDNQRQASGAAPIAHTSPTQGQPRQLPSGQVPELIFDREEGFHDLAFGPRNVTTSATHVRLHALANSGGHVVGFEIDLARGGGEVTLRSLGIESDAFARLLGDLYKVGVGPRRMKPIVRFAAVALGGHPSRLETEPLQMKLFFEGRKQEEYAEVYLNIDLARKRVELREKDPDYRRPLISALTDRVGK